MPEKAASTEQNHAVGTSRLDLHLRGIGDRPGYAPRLRGLCGESEPPRKRITFGCSWLGDRAGAGGAGLGVWSSNLGLSSYGAGIRYLFGGACCYTAMRCVGACRRLVRNGERQPPSRCRDGVRSNRTGGTRYREVEG